MTKAPITLQDLRRKIYIKAKAEKEHRFWGMYVHLCKMETLEEAYLIAKSNKGAPGIDGVTFEQIEAKGVRKFLEEIRQSLLEGTYRPQVNRKVQIPKSNGKTRTLGIPTIRDRVVQGALKLILEPIFEADFKEGSYGYRPKRDAHQAVNRVQKAIIAGKTRVLDVDIKAYFDNVRHHLLFSKVAKRVNDDAIMHLLKLICKATGKRGIPQGGPLSPLLANIFLNDVDEMLEGMKQAYTGNQPKLEYARFADDLVVLVAGYPAYERLANMAMENIQRKLCESSLELNREKTKMVDLSKGESFGFMGFEIRLVRALSGKLRPNAMPKKEARTKLITKLKDIFRRYISQPIEKVIELINPILRGWANYFRIGNSAKSFRQIKRWIEKKVRRHLARARGRKGFGWKRWSSELIYKKLGLYNDYAIRYYQQTKVGPA